MKKTLLLALLSLGLYKAGFCQSAQTRGAYAFSTIAVRDSARATSDTTAPFTFHFSYRIPVAKNNGAAGHWLNHQIRNIAGLDSSASIEQGIEALHQQSKDAYEEIINGGSDAIANYEEDCKIKIIDNDNGMVSLEKETYEFYGGMHGLYTDQFFHLDAKNKKRVNLSDIITADSLTLQNMLERHFRKEYGLAPDDSLSTILYPSFHHLPVTDNFYFTDTGLGFLYQMEEIAPYQEGIINITVPYSELKKYIRPEWLKRLEILQK